MTPDEKMALDLGTTAGRRACQIMHDHALLMDRPRERMAVALKVMAAVAGAATEYAVQANPKFRDVEPIELAVELFKLVGEANKKRFAPPSGGKDE